MGITVVKGDFESRQDARDAVEALSLFARDGAMNAGDLEDVHWHKTSLKIFVLDGEFETRDAAAQATLMAGPGDIITIPEGTLHAARCPVPATYVVGFESSKAAASFRPEKPEDLTHRKGMRPGV